MALPITLISPWLATTLAVVVSTPSTDEEAKSNQIIMGYQNDNVPREKQNDLIGSSRTVVPYYFPVNPNELTHGKEKKFDINCLEVILEEMLQIFIKEHTLSKKAHEEMIALSHQDEEIAKIFHDKELETTKKIVETLKKFGINSPNLLEKVHIIINIVDNLCHEIVYHKHPQINYDIMKNEVINIIKNILK